MNQLGDSTAPSTWRIAGGVVLGAGIIGAVGVGVWLLGRRLGLVRAKYHGLSAVQNQAIWAAVAARGDVLFQAQTPSRVRGIIMLGGIPWYYQWPKDWSKLRLYPVHEVQWSSASDLLDRTQAPRLAAKQGAELAAL